jgi:hypothetical protein
MYISVIDAPHSSESALRLKEGHLKLEPEDNVAWLVGVGFV